MLARVDDFATRIEWIGTIRFHLTSGQEVVAERVVLATNGNFLEGEVPDYGLWVESTVGELRKLGLPAGILPDAPDARRVVLALEAPDDVVAELQAIGAVEDLDALMGDDRFLDAAFGVERFVASHCDLVTDDATGGVAA